MSLFGADSGFAQCGFNLNPSIEHVSCFGNSDGFISFDLSQPTNNYNIAWAGMPTAVDNPTLDNLEAGEYSAIITDMNGCSEVYDITIVEPEQLELFGHDLSVCQESSVMLLDSINGGSGPFTISWTTATGLSCLNCNNNVSATATEEYTVTVTDNNGCTATEVINMNVADPISAIIETTPDTCGGTGTIIINPEGGAGDYTIIVNGDIINSNMVTGLNGGETIHIFIHDTTGCHYTESVIVPAAILNIGAVYETTGVSCPGNSDGSIQVIAEENLIVGYGLDDPNNLDGTAFFEGLEGGDHTIYIEDVNGCLIEHLVIIPEATAPILASSIVNCSCFGSEDGVLSMNALGGTIGIADFHITQLGQTVSNGIFTELPAGEYTIVATDNAGCEFEQILSIAEPDEILDTAIVVDCNCWDSEDGEILMNVSGGAGGFDFSRDGVNFSADPHFNLLPPGDYNILVRDTTGCTKTRQVTVEAPDTLEMTPEVVPAGCPGEALGKIVVIVSGGTAIYEYKLDEGPFVSTNTFLDLEAGTYQVTVKDANGCERLEYVEIEESETPETEINKTDATCPESPDGMIVVIVSGGTQIYQYALNNSSYQTQNSFSDLVAGFYDVSIRNDSNCVFSYPVVLESGPGIDLDIETASWETAALIDLTVYGGTPPFSYLWDTGDTLQDIYVEENGTYIVQVSDLNGCLETDTANVVRVSINELIREDVTVYPNPTTDWLQIDITDATIAPVHLKIVDERGRLVEIFNWPEGSTKEQVDISSYAEGSYQLVMETATNSHMVRLVKLNH